jgi:hypothetical protein
MSLDDRVRLYLPMAEQLGIEVPQMGPPMVNLDLPVILIAEQLGGFLSTAGVFWMAERVVTIEDGRAQLVTPNRFCSLVEEFVQTIKYMKEGPRRITMGKDLAAKIMESRTFLVRLPRLDGVLPVRVPVRRATGLVELLPAGYDAESRFFCLDSVGYDQEMEIGTAMGRLLDYFGEFQFAETPAGSWLFSDRSFCVQLVAMLNSYCRLMLPTGTPKPMFVWVANQQGSGKSVLAEAACALVYGDVATVSTPESKEEFSKLLDTTAQAMRPYLFIDDAPNFVASGALNRFVTSRRHSGRILGTPTEFDVPNVTTVLLTGNNLELTPDLMRRALIVELFVPGDIEDRTFKRQIEPGFWNKPEVRSDLLAVLWSIVRNYMTAGQPAGADIKPTFEAWSSLIGGMVAALPAMGKPVGRPMVKADLPMSGDRRGAEWRELLVTMASGITYDDEKVEFTTTDIVNAAREHKLLEDLCGTSNDKDLGGKELKRLGMELRRWRGRVLKDHKGRMFSFGARRQERGSVYPVTFG